MKYLVLILFLFSCSMVNMTKKIVYSESKSDLKTLFGFEENKFQTCYKDYSKNNKKTLIATKASLKVISSGHVEKVKLKGELTPKFRNCLSYHLYQMKFPPNREEKTIYITHTFNFK